MKIISAASQTTAKNNAKLSPPHDNLLSVSTSHKLPFKQRLCLLEKCTFLLNGLLVWYSLGYSAALDFPRSMVWNVHHCTLPSPIFFHHSLQAWILSSDFKSLLFNIFHCMFFFLLINVLYCMMCVCSLGCHNQETLGQIELFLYREPFHQLVFLLSNLSLDFIFYVLITLA